MARPGLSAHGVVGAVVLTWQAYLYFVVDQPIMRPAWAYATQEGLQVADLGQTSPGLSLEAYEHRVMTGWVHFLAQDVEVGQVANPGNPLPILADEKGVLGERARRGALRAPVKPEPELPDLP